MDEHEWLVERFEANRPHLRAVAEHALNFARRARFAQAALVNGAVGLVVAPRGRLYLVMRFTVTRGKIDVIDVLADPARLSQLNLAVLDD